MKRTVYMKLKVPVEVELALDRKKGDVAIRSATIPRGVSPSLESIYEAMEETPGRLPQRMNLRLEFLNELLEEADEVVHAKLSDKILCGAEGENLVAVDGFYLAARYMDHHCQKCVAFVDEALEAVNRKSRERAKEREKEEDGNTTE